MSGQAKKLVPSLLAAEHPKGHVRRVQERDEVESG
jgi:hypothetical protein